MKYFVESSDLFYEQILKLSDKDKNLIKQKINLIELNPYRFKRIHSKKFKKVFRIRLILNGKKQRMIYVVLESKVIIACLLLRKENYKDLEKYLSKIKI